MDLNAKNLAPQPAHTPGPWAFAEGRRSFAVHQQDGAPYTPLASDVADVPIYDSTGTAEANARLIAAAPDLLEALMAVKALAVPAATHIHTIVDAAIAKATGGAS
jgi:hypothetical protein